jgi:hypothetical protein
MTSQSTDLGTLITEVADERVQEKRLKALKARLEEILHATMEWRSVGYVSEALKGIKEIRAETEDAARLRAVAVYDGVAKPHEGIYRMEQSTEYAYLDKPAIKYAIEHDLSHLLKLDAKAFTAYLRTAYNQDNEDLNFVAVQEITRAKLKGNLSEWETKMEAPDLDAAQ